ncbi:MAG: hypothetical protein AAF488_13195 [Planctomycetota bacterium]
MFGATSFFFLALLAPIHNADDPKVGELPSAANTTHLQGPGRTTRFEVGLRLREFEVEWAKITDTERRRACLDDVDRATVSFLGGQLGSVAASLDAARLALVGTREQLHWYDAMALRPTSRLLSPGERLGWVGTRTYDLEALGAPQAARAIPSNAHVDFWVGERRIASFPLPKQDPWVIGLGDAQLQGLGPDLELEIRIRVGGEVVRSWRDRVSRVENVGPRLEACRAAAEKHQGQLGRAGTRARTALGLVQRVTQLSNNLVPEVPFAAASALKRAERLVASLGEEEAADAPFELTGDDWFVLRCPDGSDRVRLATPPGIAEGERRPLVLAVHGAGGSENIFFEAYGAGRIVQLARERGWFVVAPRRAYFGNIDLVGMVGALGEQFPIDTRQVFLYGHSMGAMHSVSAACRSPKTFDAVMLVGGGGAVRASPELGTLPFRVLAGDRDFGRRGAANLFRSLQRAGAPVEWQLIEDTEHMLAVVESLPIAFEFYDEIARSREQKR